jgi:hypothetical protein
MKRICFFLLIVIQAALFSQNIDSRYYISTIDDDFMGTYLPIEYITSLNETKNHSISLHLNDNSMYHDVLSVRKNIIYSNLKWHDQYAIQSTEGNTYQFIRNGEERIIIDHNGYSYRKIGDDSVSYYSTVDKFVANIVFKEAIEHGTGLIVSERTVKIPFLYFFLNEDTFEVNLDDMFYESGANILLYQRNKRLMIYVSLDNLAYTFFEIAERYDDMRVRGAGKDKYIVKYTINDDKRILYAMAGLDEEISKDYLQYFDKMGEYDKRVIINAMFALHGYRFNTEQWLTFFGNFPWYKPKNEIRNDIGVLNIRQKRLLEYLNSE